MKGMLVKDWISNNEQALEKMIADLNLAYGSDFAFENLFANPGNVFHFEMEDPAAQQKVYGGLFQFIAMELFDACEGLVDLEWDLAMRSDESPMDFYCREVRDMFTHPLVDEPCTDVNCNISEGRVFLAFRWKGGEYEWSFQHGTQSVDEELYIRCFHLFAQSNETRWRYRTARDEDGNIVALQYGAIPYAAAEILERYFPEASTLVCTYD